MSSWNAYQVLLSMKEHPYHLLTGNVKLLFRPAISKTVCGATVGEPYHFVLQPSIFAALQKLVLGSWFCHTLPQEALYSVPQFQEKEGGAEVAVQYKFLERSAAMIGG